MVKPNKQKESLLTADDLRELLHYDPDTGIFTRLVSVPKSPEGSRAGCKTKCGFIIRINYTIYRANRLAWLYMTGKWPPNLVDHKDNDCWNTRWTNLRLATAQEDGRNRWKGKHNSKCAFKGVTRSGKKFRAIINAGHKNIQLGTFDSELEAFYAYRRAARRYHGKFARTDPKPGSHAARILLKDKFAAPASPLARAAKGRPRRSLGAVMPPRCQTPALG